MQKLSLKLDYANFVEDDLIKYLTSLKGVNLVKIDKNNFDIYIEYDNNISLKLLKYEILCYLNLLNIPSIIGFDKHSICEVSKKEIIIKDLCCEYCLKGMIEDLLEIDGIVSTYTDFDYVNKCNVNIFITYDNKLMNNHVLEEIEKKFNN